MSHIDTLTEFDNLVASGTSEAQARAQVLFIDRSLDKLATKEDLINEIRHAINKQTIWFLGLMGVQMGVYAGIMFALLKMFIK